MTNQEAFEAVYKHLLTQMERSSVPNQTCIGSESCKYRGPRGLKCAIGCLIPDELYDPSIEGVSADDLSDRGFRPLFSGVNTALLQRLQDVHDDNEPGSWRGALVDVAEQFGLRVPSCV